MAENKETKQANEILPPKESTSNGPVRRTKSIAELLKEREAKRVVKY